MESILDREESKFVFSTFELAFAPRALALGRRSPYRHSSTNLPSRTSLPITRSLDQRCPIS